MIDEKELLERTFKIAKENNRMLHSMRRNAFIGGVIKLVFWATMIGLPIWLYVQYLNPLLANAMSTIKQVQDTGQQFGSQFDEVKNVLNNLGKIPGLDVFNKE